jgi:solute carrier family 35 protein F5
MAVGYEIDQPSAATPLSPRISDVSDSSQYMRENDFLESPIRSPASVVSMWSEGKRKMNRKLRHAIGIVLLLATVFLWTTSNFLASVSRPCLKLLEREGSKWKRTVVVRGCFVLIR